MSVVFDIVSQQYNFAKLNKYDSILRRLRCAEINDYGLLFDSHLAPSFDTPIFACKFALKKGYDQFLAIANEDGKLCLVDVSKEEKRVGIWAHNNAIFDLAWPCNQMKVVTASGDHTIKLFDISSDSIREERTFYGHGRSVKTVSFRREDPHVFATGGRDGNIFIWDTRMSSSSMDRPDRCIENAHALTTSVKKAYKLGCTIPGLKSITSLVFRDENSLISCAAGDGVLKMWDLRKSYHAYRFIPAPKSTILYPDRKGKNGFSSLVMDSNFTKLYANCLDNTIYCYNALTFNNEPIMRFRGHQNNTFYVKSCLSPDDNYLISGSSDDYAYIWRTNSPKPFIRLTGHFAEVTCVAWRQNRVPTVVTCSDDMKHKIWRVGTENVPPNWEIIGRGQAELVDTRISPIKVRPKLKRLISEGICTPRTYKKFVMPCEVCFKASLDSKCENCNPCSKTVSSEGIDMKSDGCYPRKLFGNIQPQVDEDHGTSDDEVAASNKLCDTEHANLDVLSQKLETHRLTDSPTLNLPNFIVDGVAPHINYSPVKKQDVDWLTKMREDQKFKKSLFKNYDEQDSNLSSSQCVSSLRSGSGKRKSNVSSSQSSLLNFFKVTNSKCDHLLCSNKPSSCRLTSSPRNFSH